MLDDLSDLYPTLANSLKSLLEYPDEDVEDVSCANSMIMTIIWCCDKLNYAKKKNNHEINGSIFQKMYNLLDGARDFVRMDLGKSCVNSLIFLGQK